MKYVALLRGVNVGGNSKVSMGELRKIFEDLGFLDVKTLLNSGNVVFATSDKNSDKLTAEIEEKLEQEFGFRISVIVRSQDQIQKPIDSDPFKGVKVTPDTKLYVTFLKDKPKEICNVIDVNPIKSTTDLMKDLEKKYGKTITTRNWNTIKKIHQTLGYLS